MSLSCRGRGFAFPNDRKLAPAPEGASCEKCPRIRPCLVVAPSGAAFGSAFALQQRLYFPLSAPRGLCENSPNLGAELPLPLGAARLVGVGSCFAFPQRRLRGLPLCGVGSCFAFPQRARLGLPTPPRRARCNECAPLCLDLPLRSSGRSPFKVVSSSVDVCFALSTDTPRDGGDAGGLCRPKPSAAIPSQTSLL